MIPFIHYPGGSLRLWVQETLPRGRFEKHASLHRDRELSCAIGHNGLTEVGSDVTAWANVMCTRPVPGLQGPYGYAVNNQALFANIFAKLRDNLAKVFARPGIHPCEPPHTRPLLVPGPLDDRHHPVTRTVTGFLSDGRVRQQSGVRAIDAFR
jgi:hypothetical protein